MSPPGASDLERAFRDDRVAVVAAVHRRCGDLQLAEDAVQEAFVQAVDAWARDGVPASPRGWLVTVAWRRAIDRIRSDRASADRAERLAHGAPTAVEAPTSPAVGVDDDLLHLILACCHPALAREGRVALALRCIVGLTTADVAAGFGVPEPTMAQRIVRAKRKVRDAGIAFELPDRATVVDRTADAREVVGLILTAGVTAPHRDAVVDVDLCAEAVWLARLLHRLDPTEADSAGLLSLALLTHARSPARTGPRGEAVLLEDQDRSRWDAQMVAEGFAVLDAARPTGMPGSWWLEAAIAAEHARAATPEATDWPRIALLYRALHALRPDSPVVAIGRAVAVGRADGPAAGLALLDTIVAGGNADDLAALHAALGDLLSRAGRAQEAAAATRRARDLVTNTTHRDVLDTALRDRHRSPSGPDG